MVKNYCCWTFEGRCCEKLKDRSSLYFCSRHKNYKMAKNIEKIAIATEEVALPTDSFSNRSTRKIE